MDIKIKLSRGQADLVTSTAKYPALVAGYGSGKTFALCMRTVRLLVQEQCLIGFYMPTYDLVKLIGIPRLSETLEMVKIPYSIKLSTPAIETPYGNILFRTMDKPERIVGYETGHAVVDELDTLQKDKAALNWRRIIGRNRATTPSGYNSVAVGTTPEGFRFVYENWHKTPMPGAELYRASTYDNAHNLPDNYIKDLEAQYPANLIRAYLHGEFINLNDGLFNPEWLETHKVQPAVGYYVGIDVAISQKESADYSAIVIVSVTHDGTIQVEEAIRGKWTFQQTIERIIDVNRKYAPVIISVETVQYQRALVEVLMNSGLPVLPTNPQGDKFTRALPVAALFETGRARLTDGPGILDLRDEMLGFPNGAHDDMVDAMVYAVRAAQQMKTGDAIISRSHDDVYVY